MVQVTVAEAKTQLSSLLDAVEAGQAVVITRRGKAIARLRPTEQEAGQPPVDAEWLRRVRVKPVVPTEGPALVRQMRDEQAS